jgi:hypothetical protein
MPITLNGDTGIVTPMYNGGITANAVTPSVNMKNRIINGAMVIDQRNAGASLNPADGAYALDRWKCAVFPTTGKYTVQQDAGAVTPPVGFNDYLGITSSSAYTSGSTDQYFINQRIEGFNWADLGWGTANAKTVTLSFWARSSLTGTFGGSIINSAGNRSYPFTYTINSANTWEYETVTITGETSGSWGTTNNIGALLVFNLGCGSATAGTAGAWVSAERYTVTGSTNLIATNGATLYLTGVQLEVGSTATSFDYRPFTTEFALCQRYFETNTPYGTAPANGVGVQWMVSATPNTVYTQYVPFVVSKRATPTMTVYRSDGATNDQWAYFNGSSWVSASTTLSAQITGFRGGINSSPTTHAAWIISGGWTASAEL